MNIVEQKLPLEKIVTPWISSCCMYLGGFAVIS